MDKYGPTRTLAPGRTESTLTEKRQGRRGAPTSALFSQVYRQIVAHPTSTLAEVAAAVKVPESVAGDAVRELTAVGLLRSTSAVPLGVYPVDPETALLQHLEEEERLQAEFAARIRGTQRSIVSITREFAELRSSGAADVEHVTHPSQISALLDNLSAVIKHELLAMHPPTIPSADVIASGLARDQETIRRGAQIRGIYQTRYLSTPYAAAYLDALRGIGVAVRVNESLPFRLLLIDMQVAVLPAAVDAPEAGVLVYRGPEVIGLLRAMFEHCWINSRPLPGLTREPAGGAAVRGLTNEQLTVVRMLASGMKDETIARSLGISVRTLSRMLLEITDALGAGSRFEAGVQAALGGWLT